jgi:hypothetical protein
MICAAVSGLMASSTIPDITRFIQASSGILPKVIPGQRIDKMVARILMAVPMLPKPEAKRAIVQ